MRSLAIVGMAVIAAVLYGIVHDQITARICLEYFTIGHPRLIDSDSPTVLGLFWGVVATWWVGFPLGIGMAFAARAGSRPKLLPGELVMPIAKLLGTMLIIACLAGLIGLFCARAGVVRLQGSLGDQVPAQRHTLFLVDAFAHSASYLGGILGGIVLCCSTWRRRLRLSSEY